MGEKAPIRVDWDPWKLMNVTKEELQAVAERKKMRDELKAKWQRMATNPHAGGRGGHQLQLKKAASSIFDKGPGLTVQLDPAVQRWLSARATGGDHFKVTSRTIPPFLFVFVIPVALLSWGIITQRKEMTRKIRAGELTARDRNFKLHY